MTLTENYLDLQKRISLYITALQNVGELVPFIN